ncbi:MAG TPA: Xaa-Pro aminopeptidase [Gammaproteobacteria bacterium]|nr:Xaa-Pro aminopeptidase [Gammaproteobacteria bacterium]
MPLSEFVRRRRRLLRLMGRGAAAVLPAAPPRIRNRDAEYPYRQDSDFYYLSGFPEPEAVLVLIPGRRAGQTVLFCRERDPAREIWHGRRAGPEGAVRDYGVDEAWPISELDATLVELLAGKERIFYNFGLNAEFDACMITCLNRLRAKGRSGIAPPREFVALERPLHAMRLLKSPAEIRLMRHAARVAAAAHVDAMRMCRPGLCEYELEAALLHGFRAAGSQPSYNPIVGGGANACILHYTENNSPLNNGEMVLIDAGCEVDHYASDITRTFPVNGVYSPAQRTIYELVLAAQEAAIAKCRPGNSWNAPHDAAVRVLTRGLVQLKLLRGEVRELIKKESYKRFYMHRTGHWLGMDVHDVGDYKSGGSWCRLEPGMVLTVEPGLYIPEQKGVARKWWNIGVRIEDDVLITRSGCEVLSRHVPKDPDAIEALMAR